MSPNDFLDFHHERKQTQFFFLNLQILDKYIGDYCAVYCCTKLPVMQSHRCCSCSVKSKLVRMKELKFVEKISWFCVLVTV